MTAATPSTEPARYVSAPGLLPDALVSVIGYHIELDEPTMHQGLPSPALTLVFSLDAPIITGFSQEAAFGPDALVTTAVLGGLHTEPVQIVQPRAQTGMQVAVRPLAMRALFGLPASELGQRAVHAADVLGRDAELLREQLSGLATWDERFATLRHYLQRRLSDPVRRAAPRPEVIEAWKWLGWHRGCGSIRDLARHVHLSERQLTDVFRAEVGLPPKAVSRLLRYEHARQRIARIVRAGEMPDISQVAQRCGYYDHSHLVRDFRQYTGMSPSQWIEEDRRNIQAGACQEGADFEI